MSLKDIHNANERKSILHALNAAKGFKDNHETIRAVCDLYHNVMSGDQVKTHLYWLEEQGLVKLHTIGSILNAELTARGQDVAEGIAVVPGVKRPRAQ